MFFCFDDFTLDMERLELRRAGDPVRIDALVVRLLSALVRDAGQLVTKTELIARVWEGRAVSDNVITVAMVRLRRTLGHRSGEREFVVNLHGRGYRFVRPVTTHERLPSSEPAAPTRLSGRFVGRDDLLEQLRAALASARAGTGGVTLLVGEAGIGKTRAAELLAAEASAADVAVAWGHCQEAVDTPPLWPVVQLVRELLPGIAPARAAEVEALLPDPSRPADAPARSVAKHRLFEALVTVFTEVSRARPVLLVIDDLHRADAASLELLGALADRLARLRVLVVATMRKLPPRATSHALGYFIGHRNCTRLMLEPLSSAAVTAYVAALLPEAPATLAAAIFRKSEGNPFFMVELSRPLTGAQADLDRLDLPDAALELLRPRLRSLDAAARGALSLAAVIGRSFDLAALATLSGHDARALMALLDDARTSEVLITAPDAVTTFAFGHELLRHVLYEELPPGARRAAHLSLAQLHAGRRARGEAVPAALIAYHHHAALPDSPVDEVVRWCQIAAQEAAEVFAYPDAMRSLRHAREALRLTDAMTPLGMELLLRQAVLARICAAPEFAQLCEEATTLGRERQLGEVLLHAGLLRDLHPGFPALPHARATLEEALRLSPAGSEAHVCARARLATSAPIAFDAAQSEATVAAVLAEAERLDTMLARYKTCAAALYARGGPHDPQAALAAEAAHEQLCREHPRRLTAPTVLLALHRAVRAFQAGALDAVDAALAHAAERCDELGSRELSWHTERYRALLAHQTGQARRAAPTLRALHKRARAEQIVATELYCVHDELLVLNAPVARATLERVLAAAPEDAPAVWALKLRALQAAGLHAPARTALHAVPSEALARLPSDRDYLGTLGMLARAALALDALDHARALYPLLAPYPEQLAVTTAFRCEAPVAQLLGELALAVRDRRTAARHFEAAHALAERQGLRGLIPREDGASAGLPG